MMFASSSFDAAVRARRRPRVVATAVVVILDVAVAIVGVIARPRVAVAPRRAALGVALGVAVVRVDSIARIARARSRVVVWRRRARAIVIHGVGPRSNPNPRFAFEPRARVDARSSIDARAGSPQTSARARAPRAMPRAGADVVDVETLVRRAKTRLNALYGIQHVRANARASDGANDARAIRDADAREVARGLFADDEDGDSQSLAMVKMAFCAVERKRRLERWEYGAEWLARAERDLTKARVECGEREIPARFLKPDCDYAIEEEGDVWMTFERAGRAVARRAVRRMRDGYALVPKRELAETYAEAVAREIREDCDRVLRKMHARLATGTAPMAFDPKCRSNALRIVRTYQPDASELPKISAPNGFNFAKARRERRRAQRVGGVAQHAIAIEADGEVEAIIETRPGAELRRARKALDSNVNRDVATRPFPPCIRNKMEDLRRDAHLKYHDRFQLNLFFKGIGFTVNEALEFWRRGVFPKGRMKAYQGEHTYAIRHHYGLEGAMKDYTPHNCDSLAELTEGVRTCPFVGSVEDLRQSSNSRDWYQALSFDGREAVELAVQAGDRRAACERVFADFHGGMSIGEDFESPADYFDASMEIEDQYRDRQRRDAFSSKSVAAPPPDDDAPPAPSSLLPERLQLDIEDSSSDEEPA